MIELLIFISGVVFGMVILRYGYGLGVKAVYQIKEDMPLNNKPATIEQENTSEYEGEV